MNPTSRVLSDSDRRLLDRLERQQRLWPRFRWLYLLQAALLLTVGAYVEVAALRGLREMAEGFSTAGAFQGSHLFIASLATRNSVWGELLLFAGIFLLVFTLTRWKGHPSRTLLLRLVRFVEGQGGINPGGPA